MNKLLLLIPCAVLVLSRSTSAQEYFFDNGLYVGLNANATHVTIDKKINYASTSMGLSPLSRFGLKAKDWTGSPSLTIGYKFDDYNSLSLKGSWAHYFRSRSSTAAFFGVTSVDGSVTLVAAPGVDIDIDWNSDVGIFELEYQRNLWSANSGAVLGVLGFRYLYERQEVDGTSSAGTFRFDATHEQLQEHLYGPYAGLKLSFKPAADSKLGITLKGSVGWLFKNADLRARNTFPIPSAPFFLDFAENDNSSQGTVFTDVNLKFLYSITKSLFVDVEYNFNWTNNAAHIASAFNSNPLPGNGVPARVVGSAVFTHNIGFTVFYKF